MSNIFNKVKRFSRPKKLKRMLTMVVLKGEISRDFITSAVLKKYDASKRCENISFIRFRHVTKLLILFVNFYNHKTRTTKSNM